MTAANTPPETQAERDLRERERHEEWRSEPACPNEDDPVLCKVQDDGMFVPEASCPVHDPEPIESSEDICTCGHIRAGHHRLCNGKVGKFWCHCRVFTLREGADS